MWDEAGGMKKCALSASIRLKLFIRKNRLNFTALSQADSPKVSSWESGSILSLNRKTGTTAAVVRSQDIQDAIHRARSHDRPLDGFEAPPPAQHRWLAPAVGWRRAASVGHSSRSSKSAGWTSVAFTPARLAGLSIDRIWARRT